jgi:hypothetical protein
MSCQNKPWGQLSMILETSLEICEDLSLGNISESPWEHKYNELHMEGTQSTWNSQLSQKFWLEVRQESRFFWNSQLYFVWQHARKLDYFFKPLNMNGSPNHS